MPNSSSFSLQDTRNPVAGGVVAIKDPSDQDILVAKLRIKLRMRYSMEELAEDYITRARVRQQDRGKKAAALGQVAMTFWKVPVFGTKCMDFTIGHQLCFERHRETGFMMFDDVISFAQKASLRP